MHFSELRTSAICESKNWLIIKVVPQGADLQNLPRERDTFSVSCPQEFLPRCISFQEGFVNLTFIVFFYCGRALFVLRFCHFWCKGLIPVKL